LVAQDFEVTVISTMQGTPTGVLVMVKFVKEAVAVLDSVKNGVVEDSGRAFTSIVAPEEGKLAVIFTVSGKLVPGEGASTEFTAGDVVMVIAASVQSPPPPPPFLQEEMPVISSSDTLRVIINFFMSCN
jgi:hypothetical protein